jgi:hypothetical protein
MAWHGARRPAAGATQVALVALPMALVLLGYASLHTERLYIDLMLPAGMALTFLSAVKLHDTLRRHAFGLRTAPAPGRHALATGSAAHHAEQLERRVFDLAIRHRVPVSGGTRMAGAWGRDDACWVLWNLDDGEAASALGGEVLREVPPAWAVRFAVSDDAEHDLHRALSQRDEPARTAPAAAPGIEHASA